MKIQDYALSEIEQTEMKRVRCTPLNGSTKPPLKKKQTIEEIFAGKQMKNLKRKERN